MPLVATAQVVHGPVDGIMVYSLATAQADRVFDEIRNSSTDSIYIAGGPHPSARPGECLEYFNYVVIGEGEETRVVWSHGKGVPECPSPLYYDGRIYMVKNGGMISCLDSKTGELKYQGRLGAGGPYYASLITGDGKIFASSRRGVVTVFEVGDELKVLARNDLKGRIMSTPAIVDGKLYVRTENSLFAFGLK